MKKFLPFFCVLLCIKISAQAPFWIETFGTGCNQGQYANNFNPTGLGTWSVVSTGSNGTFKNEWFISSSESNVGIGNCGDGCVTNPLLTNRTLHIAFDLNSISPGFYDFGASYLAGSGYNTNRRVQSPTINCTGQSNIILSFSYILEGVANADYADVQYSPDGGTTWTTIATPPPTNNASCSGQGFWTTYSVSLPTSANNNPTVKIGFRWQNTDPTGADPSIAVDDVALKTSAPATFAPSFTVANSLCAGNTTSVTANTGTFAVTGYTWSVAPSGAGISAPNASATAITFTASSLYTITLIATSGGTTASSTNTVMINSVPVISTSLSSASICSGQSLTLTASGAGTYTWNPGTSTGSMIVVTPTASGTYTVSGTTGVCSSTAIAAFTVNPIPTVSASASPTLICSGSSATLSSSGASTYTWNPGSLTGSMVTVSPTTSITYTCSGISLGCTGTKTVTLNVTTCTGLDANGNINVFFNVYPNPADDRLFVDIIHTGSESVLLEMLDITGKTIITKSVQTGSANTIKEIDLANVQKGLYFLRVKTSAGSKTVRFVKQ